MLTGNQATPEIAAALHGLGGIYSEYAGDHARAADYLQRALHFYQQLADGRGQAEVHHSAGIVAGWLTKYAEAEDHFQQALHLYRDMNLRSGAAAVQISRAVIQAGNNRLTEALIICQQAWQIYQTIGDREGEIIALGHLGIIAEKSGDSAEARRYFDQASQINPSGNFQVLQTIPLLPALSQDMR